MRELKRPRWQVRPGVADLIDRLHGAAEGVGVLPFAGHHVAQVRGRCCRLIKSLQI